MDRSSRWKIKETQSLKWFIRPYRLNRIFHPKAAEYTFFLSTHGTFSRLDHILEHKSSHSKVKEFEIMSSIFSNPSGIRLEINKKKKKNKKKKNGKKKKKPPKKQKNT